MCIEVIVVDDNRNAADEYAQFIKLKTRLNTIATDAPDDALNIVKNNPIKVVILDQRMPKMSGIQLADELFKIDPNIQAIMLSGEAETDEVGEAYNRGFVEYIHKNQLSVLPQKVLTYYAKYLKELSLRLDHHEPIQIYQERKGNFWGEKFRVKIKIASIILLNEEWIFEDDWRTIMTIRAGEKRREIDQIDITKQFIHESSIETKLANELGIDLEKIPIIKGKIEHAIIQRYKACTFKTQTETIKLMREYSLPPEPTHPNKLHVVSRQFQRAYIYRMFRCLLIKECDCCNQSSIFPVCIYQLTTKIKTRQIDTLSTGETKIIDTGIENY